MLDLLHRRRRLFAAATLAAVVLRLVFILKFPHVDGDTLVYGDIAKSWLRHGVFGLSAAHGPEPTYIRLPGYPGFLAAVFAVFGMEHYRAVMVVQMFFDLGTAFLIAAIARRLVSEGAAKSAFVLAALCPFLANYVAAPLTETLEVFCTALTFYCAACGLQRLDEGDRRIGWWVACGAAVAGAILLRPDGGLLLGCLGLYLAWRLFTVPHKKPTLAALAVLAVVSLSPLVPWTVRNWRTFHRVEPLVPRYANAPGEYVPLGFIRWVKTWMVDYVSVEEIYWPVPGEEISVDDLPTRAFDSPAQRARTEELFDQYNQTRAPLSPELDQGFAELARERITAAPLRYYLWLPALRSADMWLRPRTEMLPLDSRWWKLGEEPRQAVVAWGLGAIGLLYVGAGLVGIFRRRVAFTGLLLLFLAARTLFLATLENPEPRYTLEGYPVLLVFAAAALSAKPPRGGRSSRGSDEECHQVPAR